ncbi:MAG TPA: hypothetical protein VFY54_05375 [Rubrobacter sp.]|nr:hypothetical protein [Rubrobacter sp.]
MGSLELQDVLVALLIALLQRPRITSLPPAAATSTGGRRWVAHTRLDMCQRLLSAF